MLPRFFPVLTTLGLICLPCAFSAQEKRTKLDEQAAALAKQFTKSFVVTFDVEETMKVTVLPFVMLEEVTPRVLRVKDQVKTLRP
jgi:mitochondrial fission protein ELM1